MLDAYRQHVTERNALGIPALPLNPQQTADLVELLKNPPHGEEDFLVNLLTNHIPAGVDKAAYVKAAFLTSITKNVIKSPLISRIHATKLLGTMLGGYNVQPLINLLEDDECAPVAAEALSKITLVFDSKHLVRDKANQGNQFAIKIMHNWANAEWFCSRPNLPVKIRVTVFKVNGETNTDDLSPAPDAWSRPDIPLHALAMLKMPRPGLDPDEPGKLGPLNLIRSLKQKSYPLVYVGDVVGTGSSRKSATNSLLWWIGQDIPYVPNKRYGGYCIGGKIAPIFFNTMEDAGALIINNCDVSEMHMGDIIDIYPYAGKIEKCGRIIASFNYQSNMLLDEVKAGGRIHLIIGRSLTNWARETLDIRPHVYPNFQLPAVIKPNQIHGFSLAQKIVGHACGMSGIYPGSYCEPKMTTVGSQDTTGPMTRDELKDLACLGFSADLVLQSFCHTVAYPKPVDVQTHTTLPEFIANRGGISLRPGDGIIHSWLNRMLIPDTVGTGGDSHTRFPIGLSFPAGSGLVAFAAATGSMPLDMPESVLVRFIGHMHDGITIRDLVNAIPYFAIQEGKLSISKKDKHNIFNGRIIEIEGLPNLHVEQAFELSDASAERSAAGCTVRLNKEPVVAYLKSNITLIRWMIANNYQDAKTLERRISAMEAWLKDPILLEPDANAHYADVLEIDMCQIREPLLACPNDPDDVKPLSAVAGTKVDEVFIGSCMTNIGHYRAAGTILSGKKCMTSTRLWIAPPTKMDAHKLAEEGYYAIYGSAGARIEVPGCSLCMGNQARVADGATVVSTSTRNFPNRLGNGANVYLSSAELAAICALIGRIPTVNEYIEQLQLVNNNLYQYLEFDKLPEYTVSNP